jgi:hypothetical protein
VGASLRVTFCVSLGQLGKNDNQAIKFAKWGGRECIRDPSILNSTHPLDRTIVKAWIGACFEFDPAKEEIEC